jgi:cytochrome c oxidase subunit 2
MSIAGSGVLAASGMTMLSGCSGIQSALAPAGRDAEGIATLFWWMTAGTVVAWAIVIALALYYWFRRPPEQPDTRKYAILIIGGGAVVPTVVLTILLIYGLAMLPGAVAPAPEGSVQIEVAGEQWWWRVRYVRPQGDVTLANEVRLPLGEPVQFRLESDNVIHSFWIPSLGGKMDMIPGRVTYLTLRPTSIGVFRGACAEYCGTAHALMAFYVEVMEKDSFLRWLEDQARPANAAYSGPAEAGRQAFLANGCGACHAVRGTPAAGVIGPDLTHVGSRLSLAAGILANEPAAFRRWVAGTEHIKPGAHMPPFEMLADAEVEAIAAYLEALQ